MGINDTFNDLSDNEKHQKVQSLREMINSAERTIQSAKVMLLQIEGKKKVGRKRKIDEDVDGTVVEGTFDGQVMNGADGKQYPVPANYASKSKLVEGDLLKLNITSDGFFIYKQIGPIDRKHAIGVVSQDEVGNYYVLAEGKPYKVLLASITYFKAEPGDEVAMITPRNLESSWAAIENVLQKNRGGASPFGLKVEKEVPETPSAEPKKDDHLVLDEWSSDIEDIKRELAAEKDQKQSE